MANQQQFYGMPNGYIGSANGQQMPSPQMGMPPYLNNNNLKSMPVNSSPIPGIRQFGPSPPQPLPPTMHQNGPTNPPPPPSSMQQNNRVNHLASNGNSATSSRTSSPALGNNNIPSAQLPPSSQKFNLSPNWNNGVNTSYVATPPKTISGLSTPVNASTPNLIQGNPVNNLTANIQNMNISKASPFVPVAPQPQPQLQPQPPPQVYTNGPSNYPPLPSNQLPPPQQQQFPIQPQMNGNHAQSCIQPQQQQQPPKPPQTNYMPPTSAPVPPLTSQPSAFNKRPMYPTQQIQQQPQPQQQQPQQQMNNYYQNQSQQQQIQQQPQQRGQYAPNQQYAENNIVKQGFSRLWGNNTVDLMQNRHILPAEKVKPPIISLNNPFHESINCNPDIFRCTLTKIPETNSLLQKSRLPLGVLIHPFRDLNNLPVISCTTIVRCRACRTYINPFVYFVDSKKWKCNLCYRVNELPEEFQYDPVSKTYGDPTRRPEIKSSTIEFIAPSEYMLRPPQPAMYLFLLDVSSLAQQSGYLSAVCSTLSEQLDNLPGDKRAQVGFIAYNSALHFYNIAEGYNQPHEVTVLDVEDAFLPYPDNLLVNLKECKELIKDLLSQLPKRFEHAHDTHSALGAALQVAFKLMSATGGRVTVFQTCLPNFGPGALLSREDPNNRSSKDVAHLGPATDFYKRLALECSAQQIAVDLFLLNSQYCDLASISGVSKFSGGCIHHFPLFNTTKPQQVKSLQKCFERYLTRKIGFEAVMRVRCTRGLAIHTFHGNFFVRSTDLLSLPNVNPDSGFGMQITYDESLSDVKTVCFQAALLYTSSKAERRIRVHTLCIPVTSSLSEVMYAADSQCIIGILSKMAVDRSLTSNLSDARDAFINATIDILSAFKIAQNLPQNSTGIVAPENLALLPLYILALLKHPAFRTGTSTRLDDRVFAMCEMKTLPLDQLIRYMYPDFYILDSLFVNNNNVDCSDSEQKVEPPRIQLSAEKFDSRSMFLLDTGPNLLIYVGSNVQQAIINGIFDVNLVGEIPDFCCELPVRENPFSEALHAFIESLNEEKPYTTSIQIIRDTSQYRQLFLEKFVDDRNENSLSYYEFLQHLRSQVK